MKTLHYFLVLFAAIIIALTIASCGSEAGPNIDAPEGSTQNTTVSNPPTVPTVTTPNGSTAPSAPEPTEPTVPTEPTEPTVPTEPTQPTQPTEPTEPEVFVPEPATEELNVMLDKILAKYGSSPRDIYDYVHDHYKYKYTRERSPVENALHLLEYGTGSCYNFAALTYYLFQRAGYEVYYISGIGWQNNSYHCWILAYFDDGWYYVDSLYVRSAKLTSDDLHRIGYKWDEDAYPS